MRAAETALILALGLGGGASAAVPLVPTFFVGSGAGALDAQVRSFSAAGTLLGTIAPYEGFKGGVRVATGDVNGDGQADLITGAGPGGGPHVKVFDGSTGATLQSFFAYDAAFVGGVNVGAGDVNGDGRADIVTGAGPGGGPHVKLFDGADQTTRASFFAFDPNFRGGVRVAVGDYGQDGTADLIVAAGPGGGPRVDIFDGQTQGLKASFFAFEDSFRGGVSLATGRYLGQNALFAGAGEGDAPLVRVFALSDGQLIGSFFAFDEAFTGGVNLAFTRIGGRDTLLAAQSTRGGALGRFDIGGRSGGRIERENSPVYLNPFGADYMDGLSVAAIAAPVPEPISWAMMTAGFGLAGTAFRTRRRVRAGV